MKQAFSCRILRDVYISEFSAIRSCFRWHLMSKLLGPVHFYLNEKKDNKQCLLDTPQAPHTVFVFIWILQPVKIIPFILSQVNH